MYLQFITLLSLIIGLTGFIPGFQRFHLLPESTSMLAPPPDPLDTLPVVVHVIHTGTPIGSPDNPSDNLILDLIDQMNAAFQKDGPNYGGADIGFEFQLAIRSPECTSTTGINRVNGSSVPNYVTGGITADLPNFPNSADELLVKALSRWPNTDYINIWIVNTIDGDPNFPGGYAFFPEYNSALQDGIVLRASVVNSTNKTVIHELGHYFFLQHTFGYAWWACEEEDDCLVDGDWICDTENCIYTFDCLSAVNPCTDEEWIILDDEFDYTILNNYMGYTDCQWMFTEDQNDRMHYALETFRPGLLSSLALQSPVALNLPPACTPTAVNGLSPYYGIERVEIGPLEVYSNTSQADGAFYVDRTCNQQVIVAAGDSVPIRITGSYLNWSQVRLYLDWNNNGEFTSPEELLFEEAGEMVLDTVVIPLEEIILCSPLRLRVVLDLPWILPPTPCLLTGTPEEGVGQIEDYTMIIQPRQVESMSSGLWNNPAKWSCNCIPSESDFVLIRAGHTITVTAPMGIVECADLHLEPGAVLQMNGQMNVAGGCF